MLPAEVEDDPTVLGVAADPKRDIGGFEIGGPAFQHEQRVREVLCLGRVLVLLVIELGDGGTERMTATAKPQRQVGAILEHRVRLAGDGDAEGEALLRQLKDHLRAACAHEQRKEGLVAGEWRLLECDAFEDGHAVAERGAVRCRAVLRLVHRGEVYADLVQWSFEVGIAFRRCPGVPRRVGISWMMMRRL